MSEDCLYLNIYTPLIPDKDPSESLPVLFWIHRGSYYNGGSTFPYYQGMNLATRRSMVVVTIAYRLGALGFLTGPLGNLSASGRNQAMRDQLMALGWMQE